MYVMKRKLMTLVAIVGTLSAWADDYPYLVFQNADGSVKTVAVESLTITFSDGKLLATNVAGTETFALSDLSKMYFSSDATGIEEIENGKWKMENSEIFSISGQKMSNVKSQVANGQMPKGIYVVKENGKTRKVIVK